MKIIVITTYENVDEEWREWWLNRIAPTLGPEKIALLRRVGETYFQSADPTSPCTAKTVYKIIQDEEK